MVRADEVSFKPLGSSILVDYKWTKTVENCNSRGISALVLFSH